MSKWGFKRGENLHIARVLPKTDYVETDVCYSDGTVEFTYENFNGKIYDVDEIIVDMKPLDNKGMYQIGFAIYNENNSKPTKIPVKMFGVLNEHIVIEHDSETSECPKTVIE